MLFIKYSAILFIFCNTLLISQNENRKEWSETDALKWEDFNATPPSADKHWAFTACGIDYTYRSVWPKGAMKIQLEFAVQSYFKRNESWVIKEHQSPLLLEHEQLHFDISELQARMLLKAFKSIEFSLSYEEAIKSAFDSTIVAAKAMQEKYDIETDHFKNRSKQKMWEEYIRGELNKFPPLH